MNKENDFLRSEAMEMLLKTSRTFYIPISYLSPGLKEAVGSAYLCMRAIDEIEDHPKLDEHVKISLLKSISKQLQNAPSDADFAALFDPYKSILPEVTLRLSDWIKFCPPSVVDKIVTSTAIMADGMAKWVEKGWIIENENDLNDYTFYVAGLVGVMLSEIWKWSDDIETDREQSIAFGRGLQAVNILRNQDEDKERGGVDFFPDGWDFEDMLNFAKRNLALADQYIESIKPGPIRIFCEIPLSLAYGTLNALTDGKEKISRSDVNEIVSKIVSK
ncbi:MULTISPECIES: squalene/phytoene synthase family protein [Metabacillus]|jgi:farnesyl-diphosphate farnesyltransferase|uniref:Phytoene/squalene synthase family protein n=1 Tax=Metabacillus rhizolycopersici TaxID=2875709 RepID=A0ABS7UQ63_9BACI|nr:MULTISPECIES: phytoene/squalene synthase family protein [Metabacillus]MBZ5750440.1 phytoene/squalene synthase family protein [Metabacillus rhizolycopersici]MCM3652212.1 phytoene/squalene synthase family protein [Metabacillus litoralis]